MLKNEPAVYACGACAFGAIASTFLVVRTYIYFHNKMGLDIVFFSVLVIMLLVIGALIRIIRIYYSDDSMKNAISFLTLEYFVITSVTSYNIIKTL